MEEYDYQALDHTKRNIRLLTILPGQNDDRLKCSLDSAIFTSENSTHYEAVSYVWSLIPGHANIEVEGKSLTIPKAAAQVLKYLRSTDVERVVWIDSVCINQKDDSEKNHQVALMGEIYRRTLRTLVWLGEVDKASKSAFRSLDVIYDQLCEETEGGEKLRDVLYGSSQAFQYSTTRLPEACDFDALRVLFKRPWFGRRWVVQEAALAPDGIVYCGAFAIPMLKLFRCAVWIQHRQHQLPFNLDKERGMLNASYMSAYVDHEQGWFSEKHGQRAFLADLFRYFRTFDVTDEKDRVYSLLGLTKWHFQELPFPNMVTPDYKRPVTDILRDATKTAILESGDLWVFRYVDHLEELDMSGDTPSWVPALFRMPNFAKEPNPLRSAFKANRDMERLPALEKLPAFDVHGDREDANTITVQGVAVGTIDLVSRSFGLELEQAESVAKLLRQMLHDRSLSGQQVDVPETISDYDLGVVLVGGSTFDPQPMHAGGEPRDIFRSFIEAVVAGEADDAARLAQEEVFSRCIWATRFACMNRRLFRTSEERLGLGPKAMRVGDVLTVLAGSRMPMIFRARGDGGYAVLGPCYAQGIMQGEATTWAEEHGEKLKSFRLR